MSASPDLIIRFQNRTRAALQTKADADRGQLQRLGDFQLCRSDMPVDLDLSPPEVPEPTFLESLLRYGLFMGAVFQLICILAVLIPSSKSHHEQEAEPQDARANDQAKKPKGPLPQIRQKVKKESKKKR
ncbi:hypothetical protein GJAV_G00193600 [Gymnothorax javanicus]|nr:hypothetical protein GJAV_G00193600 [Gymnothorax javanicus]